jgi:hypothetical protein
MRATGATPICLLTNRFHGQAIAIVRSASAAAKLAANERPTTRVEAPAIQAA